MEKIEFVPLALDALEGDTARSLSYWRQLTGQREMPTWREFDLMKVPATLIRTSHVVDIENDADDFIFRFWGTGSAEIHNQELTGRYLSEMRPLELGRLAIANIKQLIAARQPIAVTTTLMSRSQPEKFQVILRLPLSDDGIRVTHAVTITEFPLGRYYSREAFEKHDEDS
ncbi:MAG: PAS domain-containing protein [Rhodospirillales bacterium]|nr:PAS domain-containing protein [Rhodospirillales bacterium]